MRCNRASGREETLLRCDVAVVGGGIAGVMAAAAAAKTGADTVLVEASPFLGGVVTTGPLEALMTPRDSEQTVIAGMAQEFMSFLKELDANAVPVRDTTGYCASILPYDAETMKYALMEFAHWYSVTVLTETVLEEAERTDGTLTALRLLGRGGRIRVECRAAVDATGGGRLAYLAGNDVFLGDEAGAHQPVTVLCRVGNVDLPGLRSYVADHMSDFKCFEEKLDLQGERLHLWGFRGALKAGYESGKLDLLREEIHMMQTTQQGEVIINYSRINADPWDAAEMARAQLEGIRQVRQLHAWFRETIPAFRDSYLVQTGTVGVRESGRGVGRCVLTRDDIVAARSWEDNVAMGAFPIDIHQQGDGMTFERIVTGYHIPQGCLMAEAVDNLFFAGRCISSTFEANASCRISMTCMSTGHAAGVMAAVRALWPERFAYQTIAAILKEQNAIL